MMTKNKRKHNNKRNIVSVLIGIIFLLLVLVVHICIKDFKYEEKQPEIITVEECLIKEEINTNNENSFEVIMEGTCKETKDAGLEEDTLESEVTSEEFQEKEESFTLEETINQLTLEEKAAQMFFVTPESITGVDKVIQAGDTTKSILEKYPVGGIVYFAQNLVSPEQTKEMLSNVQKYSMERIGLPVFIGIDEEGGRVLRIGSNPAFGVEKVDAMGELAKQQNKEIIYEAGNTIGSYLSELGFNVDFAPDADVLSNVENNVIGNRSFGTNPEDVAEMAWVYSEGLHSNNVLATYKHFPGHGGTIEDSHTGYAYSYKTLEEFKEMELIPFQEGANEGIDFIMVSHISTPKVTGDDIPVSLSKLWVTDILRDEMGYKGIIITDSLSMGAICEHYTAEEAAVMAIEAGCDMILMPSDFETAYSAIIKAVENGQISEERIDESVKRIIITKQKLNQIKEAKQNQ